jgi:hypothetical protein
MMEATRLGGKYFHDITGGGHSHLRANLAFEAKLWQAAVSLRRMLPSKVCPACGQKIRV